MGYTYYKKPLSLQNMHNLSQLHSLRRFRQVLLSACSLPYTLGVCSSLYLSVCMNLEISVNIITRDIKFAMKVPIYHTHIKLISNLEY